MASLPANVALANIGDGSDIIASDHRNNYSSLQVYVNALNAILSAGATGQVLVSGGGTTVAWGAGDALLPWLIDVDPFPTAIAQTNWDTLDTTGATYANQAYGGVKQSSGAQNAEISFDVVLAAGTWTVELLHWTQNDAGIYSVQFDTVEKGTVDGYSFGTAASVRSSVAGIVVSTSAKVRLKLKMATKNASSSAYAGRVSHIQLRRTA